MCIRDSPYGQWKDTGIRLEGDAVQSLTVTFLEMWNAVSDKDANDSDFSKYLFHYDYAAQQTGFVQPYADSPVDKMCIRDRVVYCALYPDSFDKETYVVGWYKHALSLIHI